MGQYHIHRNKGGGILDPKSFNCPATPGVFPMKRQDASGFVCRYVYAILASGFLCQVCLFYETSP